MSNVVQKHDAAWRYILSSGRTGTVMLKAMIADLAPSASVAHEPSPTRYQMMLANLRNDLGIGHALLRNAVSRTRMKRVCAAPGTYVEINPFLCALTDLLPDPDRPLQVVHLVREPGSWARSIIAFKASKRFRWLIDLIPYAKPYPAPRPPGWRHLTDFEKALWRWRWCNERIADLQNACKTYVVVRYEDLFSNNIAQREAALASLFETLDLPLPSRIDWSAYLTRMNSGPPSTISVDREATQSICGTLARSLGYAV